MTTNARPQAAPRAAWPRRAATAGLMLAPLLLSACYVVPVAPAPAPVYRPYHRPYYPGPYYRRPGWYGQAPAADAQVHIEVSSSSR